MSVFNSLFISRRNFLRDATVVSAGAAFAASIRPVQQANAKGDKTRAKPSLKSRGESVHIVLKGYTG